MSEFFLSTDFGILLCVFFFGVGISGRLAAWVRAIHARVDRFRKSLVRYRLHVAESEIQKLDNRDDVIFSKLHELEKMIKFSSHEDLEERIKLIEEWLMSDSGSRLSEIVEEIKKKAKERSEAIKKLN